MEFVYVANTATGKPLCVDGMALLTSKIIHKKTIISISWTNYLRGSPLLFEKRLAVP